MKFMAAMASGVSTIERMMIAVRMAFCSPVRMPAAAAAAYSTNLP